MSTYDHVNKDIALSPFIIKKLTNLDNERKIYLELNDLGWLIEEVIGVFGTEKGGLVSYCNLLSYREGIEICCMVDHIRDTTDLVRWLGKRSFRKNKNKKDSFIDYMQEYQLHLKNEETGRTVDIRCSFTGNECKIIREEVEVTETRVKFRLECGDVDS